MSILNVEHLTHGFGDRAIFQDVSFRLLKGEHIGLIGANGEGKSTFMNIITGKLTPDEGTVEWAKRVRAGYLDQHAVLEPGMTIRDVLNSAFQYLFELEESMNQMFDQMATADEDEMNRLLEETATIQELLDHHDFYLIDTKVEEVGRALGLEEIGLDRDVTELSGGQRTKVLLAKLLLEKPEIIPIRVMDEEPAASPLRIHVICGDHGGVRLIEQLHNAGHHVSIGVVNWGSDDDEICRYLDIPRVEIGAFQPVRPEDQDKNIQMMREADVVIVADIPFGEANIRNLDGLEQIPGRLYMHENIRNRDFTDGKVERRLKEIAMKKGIRFYSDIPEI